MNHCVISIGSNINPEKNINKMLELLKTQYPMIKASRLVETSPIGYTNQANFINGAISFKTNDTRKDLIRTLKGIENKCGRVKTANKNGPRTIDLDLVVWNGEIIDNDFYTRDFVKNSVLELEPDLKF